MLLCEQKQKASLLWILCNTVHAVYVVHVSSLCGHMRHSMSVWILIRLSACKCDKDLQA